MGKASPPTRTGLLSRVSLHLVSDETRNPIFAYKFSFYNLHINKQNGGQDRRCRVYGALA